MSKRALLVLALLVVGLRSLHTWGVFLGNVGWLQLVEAINMPEKRDTHTARALESFQDAAIIGPANETIYLGIGIAQTLLHKETGAMSIWRDIQIDPDILIGLADGARARKMWNEALLYYRAAATFEKTTSDESGVLAAGICQYFLHEPGVLTQVNREYCLNYFLDQGGNLVINGQFEEDLLGWKERYFSDHLSVAFTIDKSRGKPAPAGYVRGLEDGYHGGLFQKITVPPGVTIRFSAWIKIETKGKVRVRLLHFRIMSEGKVLEKGVATLISYGMEWARLEKVFRVPQVDRPVQIMVFPVLLTGKGTVWLDDVKVELLQQE